MIRASRLLVVALLLGVARVSTAQQPVADSPEYVVLLQDFATSSCAILDCRLEKPLIDGILALENKSRRQSLQEQLAVLNARLPALDLRALIAASFCRELLGEASDDCDRVKVLGVAGHPGVAKVAQAMPQHHAAGTVLVRLSIEYTRMMRFNELRLIAAVSRVSAGELGKPILYAWYVTPGGDATQSSPLEPLAQKPTARQLSTEAHWFGTAALMESEIRQSIPQLARIIHEALDYLPGAATPKRWDALQSLGDLQAAGTLKCPGVSCKFRVLGVEGERVWFVQQADAPLIMSVPKSLWN